jgi:hypothetical protein
LELTTRFRCDDQNIRMSLSDDRVNHLTLRRRSARGPDFDDKATV